jgi:signal transduction histidine kinase
MPNLSESYHHDSKSDLGTFFAPPARASVEILRQLASEYMQDPIVNSILNSLCGWALILNSQRQLLAANEELLQALQLKEMDSILGMRTGELLGCIHAKEGPSGCGTSLYCRDCGAVLSLLASQAENRSVESECLLSLKRNGQMESRELRVRTNPVLISDQKLFVMVFQDVSASKRRDVLERLFFHDVRNALAGLIGWSELLKIQQPNEASRNILELTHILSREISTHEMLILAEQGKLKLKPSCITAQQTLDSLKTLMSPQKLSTRREVQFDPAPDQEPFVTDQTLLLRILGNMVKNALEASNDGESIRVWFEREEGQPAFKVHNSSAMDETIARQVFKRSFSTKGEAGRGLGTYSMKLLGESFLKGEVSFETGASSGTIFSIRLPIELEPVQAESVH